MEKNRAKIPVFCEMLPKLTVVKKNGQNRFWFCPFAYKIIQQVFLLLWELLLQVFLLF